MIKSIKLQYRDALGTFTQAVVKVNDCLDIMNLDKLPGDLQNQLIAGDFDNELLDFEGALAQ